MKEEILSIADEAIKAIDEFENYLFANHRAKYAMSKSILDQHREHITQIKKGLELDLDDAGFNDAKNDLNIIIDDVNKARNGNYELQEPNIDTTEVDQMLESLKEERVETEYPKEDINVNSISDTINTLETTPVPEVPNIPTFTQNVDNTTGVVAEGITPQVDANMVPQIDMTSDIDVNALDAFMNTQTQQ